MTNNPLLAEFTALTGGRGEKMGGRKNACYMEINDGVVSYPKEPEFHVGNLEEIQKKGYIYLFDKETQVDKETGGEFLSYKPIKPLAVIKIKRKDFRYPIKKIEKPI